MFMQSHLFSLALQALQRNRVQTALAMLGVMVGVGALVTSMALGRGAQEAIKDQLLAAGANMIVVTAGNYQPARPQSNEVEADHGFLDLPSEKDRQLMQYLIALLEARRARELDATIPRLIKTHFEDDPMAEHDHPTARERLGDAMAGLGSAATLTLDDAEAIRRMPGVQFVAAGVHENARITLESDPSKQWFTRLHGTESQLPVIRRGWIFPYGQFLTSRQVANAEQVMVLGRVVADRLFGEGVDPIGRKVLLWNQQFTITGVVGSRSWATQPAPGDDQFDAIYVPVTTVHQLLNLSKLNTITVTTASAGETTHIAGDVTELLRQRHGITDSMADDFTVRTQAQQMLGRGLPPELARVVSGNMTGVEQVTIEQLSASLQRANFTMLALLGGVAAVSLLVGGIGVMNLLLLSVTQRTREVGLRMALGARRRDIASQFIAEAIMLCMIGGLLGAGLGALASLSLEEILQWSTVVSPVSALLAIVVAAVLGVVSGVYPATKAARLEPIGALQHE